jgi:protein O-mannosyl-transferase
VRRLWISIALLAVVFLAYGASLRNGFTGYDDPAYITSNSHVVTGVSRANTAWAWTAVHANNWHPLTWISHQMDCAMFGLWPGGHHLVSLLIHVANTLLLFWWLSGLTGAVWRSAAVALLFGLHPVHVESVAWASERKDVLSAFFGLLALVAYTTYARRPGVARYAVVAFCFAASLLAKPMLVTLPVLLLILDWWPLKRRAFLEKLPLFTLSAGSAAMTIWAQHRGGALNASVQLGLGVRLANAALSCMRYVGKTAWPSRLAVFYPFRTPETWMVAASVAGLLAATVLAWRFRRSHPWLLAGWCWFLVALLPAIGIVQVGMQAMADRYLYLAIVGVLVAAVWEGARLGRASAVAAVVAAACLGVVGWRQTLVWQNGVTLFEHAIAVTGDNFVAQDNLGVELDRLGRKDEALAHYAEAVRIEPGDRNSESNYALATFEKGRRLFYAGQLAPALASFQEGLRHRPSDAGAHLYAGLILTQQKRDGAAEFRTALSLDPSMARAHIGLGGVLSARGQFAEARREFEEAIRCDPADPDGYFDLALVLATLGDFRGAVKRLDEVLRIKPDFEGARNIRAQIAAAGGISGGH